jgi:hypothetical protein
MPFDPPCLCFSLSVPFSTEMVPDFSSFCSCGGAFHAAGTPTLPFLHLTVHRENTFYPPVVYTWTSLWAQGLFFLFVCFLRHWGLNSGPTPWTTTPAPHPPFLWWVTGTICLGWLQTAILLISASWVARLTGVSHWCPAGTILVYLCVPGVWNYSRWCLDSQHYVGLDIGWLQILSTSFFFFNSQAYLSNWNSGRITV